MRRLLFSVTIRDCHIDNFTVPGPGGGGKDTSQTGRRVTHLASGAIGKATDTRSGQKNTRLAFERMAATKTFLAWHRVEAARRMGAKSIEQIVDEQMEDKNLLVEVKDEKNRWTRGEPK